MNVAPTAIETLTGRLVDFVQPDPETIRFEDIVRGLSRAPRFVGQTEGEIAYTVAQHSVWVARFIQARMGGTALLALQGLLHDAHEAYTGDLARPFLAVPGLFGPITEVKRRLQVAIHDALKVPYPTDREHQAIKYADDQAMAVEAYYMKRSRGEGWTQPVAHHVRLDWRRTLPEQEAHQQFWLAFEFLRAGKSLEAVWQ